VRIAADGNDTALTFATPLDGSFSPVIRVIGAGD
jgi:hypothetical protein